jgi:RHS repeat-associated protein
VNNIRLPGQYYDQETGFHYNYHRYYDPRTGRYITADPVGQVDLVNLFVYAVNNPINLVDVQGLRTYIPLSPFDVGPPGPPKAPYDTYLDPGYPFNPAFDLFHLRRYPSEAPFYIPGLIPQRDQLTPPYLRDWIHMQNRPEPSPAKPMSPDLRNPCE